jgi:hypothetical protein
MEKVDLRGVPDPGLNEHRRRSVELREAGVTVPETARECELSTHAVVAAHKAFQQSVWAAVKAKPTGRSYRSCRRLSAEQERQVQWLVQDRTPDQLKMSCALWTRLTVSELFEARFGIGLTMFDTGKYPKRWWSSSQRPLKRACEQSPVAVSQWHNESFPTIAQCAKQEEAEIQRGYETGLLSDDVRVRGYAPKGTTPAVRTYATHQNLSVMSTVTNKS